jgi:molybdopterin molybdotransferase
LHRKSIPNKRLAFLYDLSMQNASVGSTVLTFEDALRTVEEHAARIHPPSVDSVDLMDAIGRVLAEPVTADRDFPPFPRATRDGYAVRSVDLSRIPATLNVIGEIKAGEQAGKISTVAPGHAVSIMTGAPVPAGADAIVMVEYTLRRGDTVEITKGITSGDNIVPRGAEARQGSLLLDRGQRFNAPAIALAASVGKSQLQVHRRPRVAVLATGDEIVNIDSTPGPAQIRNSNTYSLTTQIREAGSEPVLLPIAPDEPHALRHLIKQGFASDLLLITGGVSMGRYDLVEQVLAEMQAEFFFTGAQIQPGRPVVFGKCSFGSRSKYFFGLPGNPVSTMVTFDLFVRPMLAALAGASPQKLRFLHARLKSDIRVKTGLRRFLPATLTGEFENSIVELVPWQGSGDIAATARANCYLVIPSDCGHIPAGDWVAVMPR